MTFEPKPGLHVLLERDAKGRPHVVILECHTLPPHDVIGRVDVRAASHLQALIRQLKARLDMVTEETRARVRPESCGTGMQVERRPTLDELDDGSDGG